MQLMFRSAFSIIITLFAFTGCTNPVKHQEQLPASSPDPAEINYTVTDSLPHDTTSFTEGLLFHDGKLFESTGHTENYPSSRSLFGIVDSANGRIRIKAEIDRKKYFGEGIVFLHNHVYQLTDTTHIGFVYDASTYKQTGEFHYPGEGWGLTTNGKSLIMTNGSSTITWRNPENFQVEKSLTVRNNDGPVNNINEPELINGSLYTNRWLTNEILKIDTSTGMVTGKLDLSALVISIHTEYPAAAELNGIAFDPAHDRILITGKLWPKIYQVKFVH